MSPTGVATSAGTARADTVWPRSAIVITHYAASGPPQELAAYLASRGTEVLLMQHPLPGYFGDGGARPSLLDSLGRTGDDAIVTRRLAATRPISLPLPLELARHFALTLLWVARQGRRFDLAVGAGNINAVAALLLRRAGRVRHTVFYAIDFAPRRFGNAALNAAYLRADRLAATHSDAVWNLSPRMVEGRRRYAGVAAHQEAPQLTAPMAVQPIAGARAAVPSGTGRWRIVYMGHLRPHQGVETLVDALPTIRRRAPEATLRVVGGGPLEDELRARTERLGVHDAVELVGFVESDEALGALLADCAVAVAPYQPAADSFTWFADPGKVKTYLAAALPVIITRVPRSADLIEQHDCGAVVEYEPAALARAISDLLLDPQRLAAQRRNALALSREFTWERVFGDVLGRTREAISRRA